MCVIYTVRAYIVCENDRSFEGHGWYRRKKRRWDQVKESVGGFL